MSSHIFMAKTATGSSLTRSCLPGPVNIDVQGWQVQTVDDAGVSVLVLTAESNAEYFPLHSSEDNWLAFVTQGEARLFSGNATDIADGVDCKRGDFISFEADVSHSWQILQGPFQIVLAKT